MLTPGAEKEVDKRIAKFFGAYTPTRDMKAEFRYVDESDVGKAATDTGNSGATPNGFVDYKHSPPIVYINRNPKIQGTLEHETLHLYGLKLMSYYGVGSDHISHVFEGLTEYLTRQMVDSPRISYQAEYGAVQKLVNILGEVNLRTMFFQWKPDPLMNCLSAKIADEWKKQVNNKKWDDAEKLLKGLKPCAAAKK